MLRQQWQQELDGDVGQVSNIEIQRAGDAVDLNEAFLPDDYYNGTPIESPALIRDNAGNIMLYRVMSEAEYNSLMNEDYIFTSVLGSMESKWLATTVADAHTWGQRMNFEGNYRIIEITIPEVVVNVMYYGGPNLDSIGPAFNAEVSILNKYLNSIRTIK